MANKQVYDVILPFGYNCKPAWQLKLLGLRRYSYPFDWFLSGLENIIDLFEDDFESFFKKYHQEPPPPETNCKKIVDTKNNIVSLHDVKLNDPVKESVEELKKKIKRRYNRLKKYLDKADSILLVNNLPNTDMEFLEYSLNRFSKLYKDKTITLINIDAKPDSEFKVEQKVLSKKLRIIKYTFDDEYYVDKKTGTKKPHPWYGDPKTWKKILSRYKLNDKIYEDEKK